jgi:hypothetical protein
VTEVALAIQAHTPAIARLIRLLKHRAAAVQAEAAVALHGSAAASCMRDGRRLESASKAGYSPTRCVT